MVIAELGTDLFRGLLQGLPAGSVYALVAIGFVLTYKTSGVFNLAFGAQAYVSAAMYFKCTQQWDWPILPSVIVSVVILAPLLGLVLERLIFRHLRTASAVSKLVVTLGLTVAIPALFGIVANFKAQAGQTPVGVVPDGANVFYDPFGVYSFSRDELVTMAVALAATAALGALFKFTALGLRMRAVVESPRMTELNGVASDRVSAFAWALSSFFAGLAGVLIAPRFNTLAAGDFFNLVVVAIAAAAIGLLVSLPRALVGGLALGVFIAWFNTFLPRWANDYAWLRPLQDNLTPAIPFVVLFAVLVFVPSIRRSHDARDPLADVDPPPRSLGAVVRDPRRTLITTLIGVAALAAIGAVVLTRGDQRWLFLVTQAAVLATVFLSITVITGFAGQISLCQGAFAATGAFTVYQLVQRYDISVLLAALIGAAIASVLAAVLSLPIRRLGGVWTAIATLAFAYFFDSVIVKLSWVGGGEDALLQGTVVPRPVLGPVDFGSDKSFLVLTVVVFALVALVVTGIRTGTLGRILVAVRGSEVGAASIGVSAGRSRLAAFAISGFIAGLGGAFMAMLQGNVNYATTFAPFVALFWLVIVVTLSARTVQGAAMAAASFALFDAVILKGEIFAWILRSPDRIPGFLPLNSEWLFVLFGFGAIQYARHPEGALEYSKRRMAARSAARQAARGSGPAAGGPSGASSSEPLPVGGGAGTSAEGNGADPTGSPSAGGSARGAPGRSEAPARGPAADTAGGPR
jgi:branched-chain amino acid transport system permease protein